MENQDKKEKTVYIGITGDIIHPGIINIIQKATTYGRVIVGLLTDSAIVSHKRLPALTYEQRKNVLENIKGVSEVIPQKEWSYIPNLKALKPNYIIHGDDWKSNYLQKIRLEVIELMKEIGGEVIEIPYTKGIDSDKLFENTKTVGTTPDIRLKSLRRLIKSKPIVRIMEAHSALSGLIVENIEIKTEDGIRRFDGLWSSSLCDSTDKGKPDIEVVSLESRMQILKDILMRTTKPIIYDGDTGGIPEHFVFMVKTLEMNGISAVIIEDKTGLKKNSLLGTSVKQTLLSEEEFCYKISQGKKAQVTPDFMIIARIEEIIAGKTVDEALKKALACVMAGADGIMIHSKEKSGKDIKEFCQRFRKEYPNTPLVLVPTTYNQFTEKELSEWGANIIIYANHLLRAEYPAMKHCMETILKCERGLEANELCKQ
jgi:phosphoenolpyruvate phosphomutase